MKRFLMLLLCLLLLCGCSATEGPMPTLPEEIPSVTEAPTEPAGLYESGSELEQFTAGAVKVFPLDSADAHSMVPFGKDLLVLRSGASTTLLKLSGENLYVSASVTLDCSICVQDPALQVSEKGVTYFDGQNSDLVFLDTSLTEVSRYHVPEQRIGQPALSADRKNLYYLTADALRAIDLDSGIDRLVKQMSYGYQSICGLYWNSTVLQCEVGSSAEESTLVFLSTATGQILAESENSLMLQTANGRYFATRMDGTYPEALTGTESSDVKMLHYPDQDLLFFPVLDREMVITAHQQEGSLILDCYRLTDGTRPYRLTLPGNLIAHAVSAVSDSDTLWILLYDESQGRDLLCRWNPEESVLDDDTVYIGDRRTPENPDEFGLDSCAQQARELSAKHGVQILVWEDATKVQPSDYTFTAEHQVPVIRDALIRLDAALSYFPSGFLKEATSEMGDGKLRISLVRTLAGITGTGSLDAAEGIQFWEDGTGNTYVVLRICPDMEKTMYHELFHIIESRIFSLSLALDDWEKLNPDGFSYDYSYLYYAGREDLHLIEGDSRAFVDLYSMTFPKEDRARIMEYAMTEGNESLFDAQIMQNKLRALCLGIREAYKLEESEGALLWEQYLKEPF